jgi:hypothetical protein
MNTLNIFSKRNSIILGVVLTILLIAGVTTLLLRTQNDTPASPKTEQTTEVPGISQYEMDARKKIAENKYSEAILLFDKALVQASTPNDKERIETQIEMARFQIELEKAPENLEQGQETNELQKQSDGSVVVIPNLEP